ncbi:MAG: hypothetical protein IH586_21045 [Anaerolineaceae bacterium]|nr:hypothetical protein [Anaerolineaceae bacterium]
MGISGWNFQVSGKRLLPNETISHKAWGWLDLLPLLAISLVGEEMTGRIL